MKPKPEGRSRTPVLRGLVFFRCRSRGVRRNALSNLFGVLALAGLAAIGNWIAFGLAPFILLLVIMALSSAAAAVVKTR